MQPLYRDEDGVIRFAPNPIVRYLLDAGPFDMNDLAMIPFALDHRRQFAQLIGYSLDGYADLPYVDDEDYAEALKGIPECEST